ncbi:spore germination protein KB [Paenibacillus cellulosilyticus]|uniref:Spore germination protein KB n=2 Tax=Paenibacillus cellulosilyticus TaxID=375489 RepID=A0A2V2YZV1_9BACL|nr:endospore germination permease [Paenibacillus cellulosilyticus]PWW08415.1 spore germination protein KB [Paenibacillus cellulosilyticus]QKS48003.1 endospore germination permease [Paenibacillus cellulosilyticus]
MLFLSLLATATLTSPAIAYSIAHTDMWMTPMLGSLGGLATIYIASVLHHRYPGNTLIQYSELILGRVIGRLISLTFLIVCLMMNANQLRQFAELMSLAFMTNTPIVVFASTMILVSSIAVRLGVEIIGRLALTFTPLIVGIVVVLILPLLSEMEPDQILPFMDQGFSPIIRGSVALQVWFPMYIYASMFLPYISDLNKAAGRLYWTIGWSVVTFMLTFFYVLMALGAATSFFSYPFLLLSRYVSIASFMTHLDSLIMIVWVIDVFVRTIVMYYAAVSGLAQWFKLRSYKPLTLPVGLIIILLTFWSIPDATTYNESLGQVVIYYYIYGHLCIPIVLYIISLLRGGKPAVQP